ncbi:hypothetical protein ACWGST_05925 [Agromyces sp. NPDC055520]
MQSPSDGVRPTRRCLNDIKQDVPNIGTILSSVTHPLITRAQAVPDLVGAAGAERIVSLADLVWFKVKTQRWRGATVVIRNPACQPFLDSRDASTYH